MPDVFEKPVKDKKELTVPFTLTNEQYFDYINCAVLLYRNYFFLLINMNNSTETKIATKPKKPKIKGK